MVHEQIDALRAWLRRDGGRPQHIAAEAGVSLRTVYNALSTKPWNPNVSTLARLDAYRRRVCTEMQSSDEPSKSVDDGGRAA